MTNNLHSVSLFIIICVIILQAGDIETNPGPTIPENVFFTINTTLQHAKHQGQN